MLPAWVGGVLMNREQAGWLTGVLAIGAGRSVDCVFHDLAPDM